MEHILPLPKVVRDALIDRYCPVQQRNVARTNPENRDCLIRIYLARRRGNTISSNENFSLRNFEADLSFADDLIAEKSHHAIAMAMSLACMHWEARVDGADVEFVLGTAPEDYPLAANEIAKFPPRTNSAHIKNSLRRVVQLWLLDFNQVGQITMDDAGITKALAAFWQNDPYFPRPVPESTSRDDNALWEIFREAYLDQSSQIHNPDQRRLGLAMRFIKGVEEEAEKRAGGPPSGGPARGGGPPREGGPPGGGGSARRGTRGKGRGGRGRGGMTGIPEIDTYGA